MKETIAEYARVILVLISFAVIGIFVLGGTWFNRIGSSLNGVGNEVQVEHQQDIMDKLSERETPVLEVHGATYTTGTLVKLPELIKYAYVYDDEGTTQIPVKEQVVITCDSEGFDSVSKTLLLNTAGVYSVKYSIKDSYGLTTTKLIRIVAVDRALNDTE
jgi:hypothetical protein